MPARDVRRRIFVGDIQGCREELERLLEAIRFDPEHDELHPTGDAVNRGPDSAGTLRLLRRVGAGGVLGNHDVHTLRVAAGLIAARAGDTIDDLLRARDRDALLAWLRARPFVRTWDDVVLVHAGLDPTWDDPVATLAGIDPLSGDPRARFATLVRHCDPAGGRPQRDWPPPPPPFVPWYEAYRARHPDAPVLVWGHWARRGLVALPGVRGLDTGCVWGGKLTAWIAEDDRFVQVDAARAYATTGD
jgi:bis(5'-nucleosyl)-tetraphosphatase (symmetrical)